MGLFDFFRRTNKDPRIGKQSLDEQAYQDFDRSYLDTVSQGDFVGDYIKTDGLISLWQMSSDRSTKYQSFDSMSNDSIIASALEMYADDASQYDADNRVIWVESPDPAINQILNNWIKSTRLGGHLWSMYYSLAKYGDVYIRLYKYRTKTVSNDKDSDREIIKYENYFSVVDTPESVFDLTRHGNTSYFAVTNKPSDNIENNSLVATMNDQSIQLYPADQFVHIYLDKPDARQKDQVSLTMEDKDGDHSKDATYLYDVEQGKSMLEDVYAVQKQIQLLETSLVLNRLSKAAITRIVSIEVGDMPSTDTAAALRRVKSALENRVSFDSGSGGMNNYMTPGGMDNIVVVPTRQGKGAITQQTIGGDVDVKSLADLDYFNNKRFGGLKIPKAFLGFEEALGLNGGGTLTKQDIRYGRTIKRMQTAMVTGITQLMVDILKTTSHNSPADLTNFTVKVVPPTTSDDDERDAMSDAKFKVANNIVDLLADQDDIDKKKLLTYVFTNVLNEPELVNTLSMTKDNEPADDEPDADAGPDDKDKDKDKDTDLDTSPVGGGSTGGSYAPSEPEAPVSDTDTDTTPEEPASPSTSGDELKQGTDSQTVTVPSQDSAIK